MSFLTNVTKRVRDQAVMFEPPPEPRAPSPLDAEPSGSFLQKPTQLVRNRLQQAFPKPALPAPPASSQPAVQQAPAPVNTGDPRAYFDSLFPGDTLSVQQLAAREAELNQAGIRIAWNADRTNADIILPNGQVVDVIQGAATGLNRKQWLIGGGGGAETPAGSPAIAQAVSPAVGGTAATAAPTVNPFLDQMRAMLLERMGQLKQPFDENAPEVVQPMGAARREVDRSNEQARKALAEKLYAEGGLNTQEMSQGTQQLQERGGEALSSLKAKIIGQELTSRRAELQSLMGMALASGDAEATRSLQAQLAAIDAELRRAGIAESGRQFDAGLGQRGREFDASLGQRGREFDASLGQRSREFNDTYGLDLLNTQNNDARWWADFFARYA